MSENIQGGSAQPQFVIQRIYCKDISFETPNSPAIFMERWEPAVNVELGAQHTQLGEGVYEVILAVTVTAKQNEKTVYLVEVKQAGIFTVAGFNPQDTGFMLGAACPNILFPYARELLSDLVARGTFPQMVLAPVNFEALYAQHVKNTTNPEIQ